MSELKRILYVEDDPDIQTVAKMALEMIGGFSVRICPSGQDALEHGGDFAPQMILLDVMMPGMDGPTTLSRLRNHPTLGQVPVAFMTAKAQADEIAQLMALGALAVITKPFDPMALSNQVRQIWEGRPHG